MSWWLTGIVALIGGVAGGVVSGAVQAWVLIFWRSMMVRKQEAKTDRIREEVAREWCDNCGQRLDESHPEICMPGVKP